MNDKKENKIDAAIDTVLESERLKQGGSKIKNFLFTILKGVTFITPLWVIGLCLSNPRDTAIYIGAGAFWMLVFGFSSYLLRPRVKAH